MVTRGSLALGVVAMAWGCQRAEPVPAAADDTALALASAEAPAAAPAGAAPATPAPVYLGFSLAEVVHAAGGTADAGSSWRVAEWSARANTLVALSFRPGEFGEHPGSLEPRLVVLERQGSALTLLAEKRLELDAADCRVEHGEAGEGVERAPELQLDLAPYIIAPEQTAIGVRFTCFNTFPAGDGSETRLALLELRAPTLRQVFDERVANTTFDRPTGHETSRASVVSVDPKQHEGHFDLLVRTTLNGMPGDSASDQKPALRTESVRFVWRGERYAAAGGG